MGELKKYIVKLKPVGPFFFGGEKTFGSLKSQNYFTVSDVMPQVSSIVGLLRFLILKNNLGLDCKAIADEIGPESFTLSFTKCGDRDYVPNMGRLKSVSPVFITDPNSGAYYTRMPLDSGYSVSAVENVKGSHVSSGMVDIKKGDEAFEMKKFDNYMYWTKVTDGKVEKVKEDDFIKYDERIGINKGERNGDDHNFFKQKMVRFLGDEEFIFTTEIEENNDVTLQGLTGEIVKLGASSLFRISIEEGNIDWKEEFKSLRTSSAEKGKKEEMNKIILLSDMYLPDFSILYEKSIFVWGISKTFRSIITKSEEEHSWSNHKKSALYRVLPAGTVIFFKDEEVPNLLSIKGLVTFGFNLFI